MSSQISLTDEDILSLAKKAYQCNELYLFLSGEKEYACPIHHSIPANVPTDLERILFCGIYSLYNEEKDDSIIYEFKKSLDCLLDGTAAQVWVAYMVCLFQTRLEFQSISPFMIMTPEMINRAHLALIRHKEDLKQLKKWQGIGRKEGLWQNIVATNDVLREYLGVTFL